jgi:signal peptidase I
MPDQALPPDTATPAGSMQNAAGSGFASTVREIIETLAIALLVFLLIQLVWRNFRVEGYSMEPNVHDGQFLLVERLVYSPGFPSSFLRRAASQSVTISRLVDSIFHSPRRGEIIVFIPPSNPQKDYIKRVIGIAGDKVEIRQGRVYVNDHPLTESYILPGGSQAWGPAIVGKDELFVLGDNRSASTDSRFFGMLPMKNVIGKAWLCFWPPWRVGFTRHASLDAQLQASR